MRSREASIFVAICASLSWIAWWWAIGFPNASRSCAYRIAASNAACAIPTARAAMFTRPSSIPPMNCLKPRPSLPPSTDSTGVRKPSKTSSVDSTPLYPSFLSGRETVRPGCSWTFGLFLDDEGRHTPVGRVRLGVGLGEQHDAARVQAVGGPHLLAGDDVLVALAHGPGANRLDVGAGVRLGHRVGEVELAGGHAREVAAPAAPPSRGRPDHPGGDEVRVEHAGKAHPAARELHLDAGVRREVETEAAVLLRDRDAKEAELLHRLDERRRVLVGVLELRGDRHDLSLDELPDGRDDLPLLGALLRRAHQAGARSSAAAASGASAERRSSCSSRASDCLLERLHRVLVERQPCVLAVLLPHLAGGHRVLRPATLVRQVGSRASARPAW